MTAKVILNPYSNRWNSKKRWPDAEAALKNAGLEFDLVISNAKGQIVELAEQAARQGCSPIIITRSFTGPSPKTVCVPIL